MTDEGLNTLGESYSLRRKQYLEPLKDSLLEYLEDSLRDEINIDRISARVKSAKSFCRKARNRVEGQLKYQYPLSDIQDQIGARVVVRYLDDVGRVGATISSYFGPIEEQEKRPDSHSEFGYEGRHFILLIPDHVYPDTLSDGFAEQKVFELQIKTLFQHAWGEAGHDLAYKSASPLDSRHQRLIAFTAAQAWGADKIFSDLVKDLDASNDTGDGE